ncbi:hypothetical protein [Gemmata algarum]
MCTFVRQGGAVAVSNAARATGAMRLARCVTAALACALVVPHAPLSSRHAPEKLAARAVGADWPMAAKDFANTRYSELDQISTRNAGTLKLAWTFDTGIHRGQRRPRSSPATRCSSSPRGPTCRTPST